MEQYWIEGLFVSKQGLKRARKSGRIASGDVEPFAKTVWANSPAEALMLASEALEGGEWTEGPRVAKTSEEQRMRALGAPELPGFGGAGKKRKK